MPKREMGHVEKGRASGRTGVDDLENRIEVAIEVVRNIIGGETS